MMGEMRYFSPEVLRADEMTIYRAAGLSEEDAGIISDALIENEMTGIASHGLIRTRRYVDCILSGGIRPEGRYEFVYDNPSWAVVDGLGGLGIIISVKATELCIQKARETGIGIVNVRHSHHFGAAGQYTRQIARENMFGMAMSNTGPMMAVTGTNVRCAGNNPFSYCVPAGKYDYVMLDMAMSRFADGKLQVFRAKGLPMPPDTALDKFGNPTTDPNDYFAGGILLPFGDYKAYGLAVMVDLLSGILSGAGILTEVNAWNETPGTDGNTGHFFMALDIGRVCDIDEYIARVEQMVDWYKSAPPLPGVDKIRYPGEPEQDAVCEAKKYGIGLPGSTIQSLNETAERLGVQLRFLNT
ncbi:MAG: Ldh family oxidoreductase [Clostridiales bacterium]|nr:Ldh family oxidoreductase [Clostridiales bacterium]